MYEVTTVLDGKLIDFEGHWARLHRSLKALELTSFSMSKDDMLEVHRELVTRNSLREGMVYLQITRGDAEDR